MNYVEIIDLHNKTQKKAWIYSIWLYYACMVLYKAGILVISNTGAARLTNGVVVCDEDKMPT